MASEFLNGNSDSGYFYVSGKSSVNMKVHFFLYHSCFILMPFNFFLIFYWRIIALQYCAGFCQKWTQIFIVLKLLSSESVQFSRSVMSNSATPWTAAHQASLSITNSRSLLRLMSIESVMPSNYIILSHPLLLPSIFPSIRVFSNESVLCIRWPKYWELQHQSYEWIFRTDFL